MTRTIMIVLGLLFSLCAHAQTEQDVIDKIGRFSVLVRNEKITEQTYMDSVDELVNPLPTQGILFEKDKLIGYLDQYRQIAWSSKKYGKYRINYFMHLAKNADMLIKGGEALYFYKKAETEIEKEKKHCMR